MAKQNLSISAVIRYDHAQADLDGSSVFGGGVFTGNAGYNPNEQWALDAFASYERDYTSASSTDLRFDIHPDVFLDVRIVYKPIDKLTLSLNGQAVLGTMNKRHMAQIQNHNFSFARNIIFNNYMISNH